ncbi:gag/pol protein [Cucumis melo var. makuwa]|uniref:Gag/pol protein n=1 Tax=Cucumis melo var. makuwa TaxID=1194695 RepID=A0A5D3DWJ5_CUCMM|nr:gag/pol protein [Cucumis melo var. makuwa]TYK27884.1 gag/pol protein [Cucumis melo var. makuwa]
MPGILSKKHEIMVTARQIMDSLREMFGQPSIQIKQEANVAHSKRFAPSSSGSEKIQKRKEGKGKRPTIAVEGKGKAKYLVKKKEKEGATNHVCSSLQETSSFKQLEESEMTLKVGTRDIISARAVRDAKLGYINLDWIGRLVKNGLLNKLEDDSLPPCESCLEGKMTKRPFTGKGYRAKEPLELIHSDLCGPMNVKARGGFEYFISFIDDYSRYGYLYLMEHKSEALEKFKEYKTEVVNYDRTWNPISTLSTCSFWGYAVETAVHILNNIPSKSVSETPFKLWRGCKPSLSHFRIWGCPKHMLVTNPKKLEPRLRLCQFVGYPKETRSGLFFDPQENRVFVSTNATFLEEDHMRDHKPRSKLVLNEATDESTRVVDEVGPSSRVDETATSDDGVKDPLSYKQAMNDVDKDQWVKAMNLEMESIYFNSVWELVDLPKGVKPIGCKWIYKRKRDSAGKVQTFKVRLVAKGILLSIATFYDYEIWQMDVKTAFLNGNLEEIIFISQLEGFITEGQEQKVCKLNQSIYGLKQASRSWNIRFDTAIKSYSFDQNVDEPCVYKKINKGKIAFLVLYVDDILLIGNEVGYLTDVKAWLAAQFQMKDLGEAQYNSKKGLLPFRYEVHLSKEQCPKTPQEVEDMRRIPYASDVGSLMYVMLCTRLDICYAVGIVSRYKSNPGLDQWAAVKIILKYLRRTRDYMLVYGAKDLILTGYTDSDFQTDKDSRKSTSGSVFTLNGGAVV